MKKSIFFISIFIVLNGCAQYSAFLGPTYTLVKSGSVLQAGSSMFASYGIEKTTGKTPGEHIHLLVRKNHRVNSFVTQNENIRECETIHSSSLNEIFFETLDGIDCFRDPSSILK